MFSKIAILSKVKTEHIILACFIFILLITGLYALALKFSAEKFDAAALVTRMEEEGDVFEGIRVSLKDIIDTWGVQAAIDVNEYAFVNNKIGIYHCHVLSHLTGHEAVVYYGDDYDAVINHDTHFCEVGYRHGAEAQVALSGGDYKNNLYEMCEAILRNNPSAECFHGAGHAFMNESLDVDTSLKLCDELINEQYTEEQVTPCYNAVFAELTNLVGGMDGGTGIAYTGGPPLSMDEKTPLEYCAKFDKRYGLQCVFEFSGLGISSVSTPKDIEEKLLGCSSGEYDSEYEAACIRSVSAVGAQHELARNDTITVPQHILALPSDLREAYISGAGTELLQYLRSGADRNWQTFCDTFTEKHDLEFCLAIFTS